MDKDLKELVEYLDEKFQKTANKEDLLVLSTKSLTIEKFDQFKRGVEQEFNNLKNSLMIEQFFANPPDNKVSKLHCEPEYVIVRQVEEKEYPWDYITGFDGSAVVISATSSTPSTGFVSVPFFGSFS